MTEPSFSPRALELALLPGSTGVCGVEVAVPAGDDVANYSLVPDRDLAELAVAIQPQTFYAVAPDRSRLTFIVSVSAPERGRVVGQLRLLRDDTEIGAIPVRVLLREGRRRARAGGGIGLLTDRDGVTLPPGGRHIEAVRVTVRPPMVNPRMDVYVLADCTVSMQRALDRVRDEFPALLGVVRDLGADIAVGVAAYRDGERVFEIIQAPTTDLDAAAQAMRAWIGEGGGDEREGQLGALYHLAEPPGQAGGWRVGAKRLVLWIGDSPGHPEIELDSYGQRFVVNEAMVSRRLATEGITLHAFSVASGSQSGLDAHPAEGQATRLCAATGGAVQSDIAPADLANVLGEKVLDEASHVARLCVVATGPLAEFVDELGPSGGYGDLDMNTERDFRFFARLRVPGEAVPAEVAGCFVVVADGQEVASLPWRVMIDPAAEGRGPGVTAVPASFDLSLPAGSRRRKRLALSVRPPLAVRAVDIFLLADTTASMGPALASVLRDGEAIVRAVSALGVDAAFGVACYRDVVDGDRLFEVQQTPTCDLETVLGALAQWDAGGGGDVPEGQLYALSRLAQANPSIGWRPGSRRIVVWFGDACGHDPLIVPGPDGERCYTADEVTAALVRAGVSVVALSLVGGPPGGLDSSPARGQASAIAAATGGRFLPDVDAGSLVDDLLAEVKEQSEQVGRITLGLRGSGGEFVRVVGQPRATGPISVVEPRDLIFDLEFFPPPLDGEGGGVVSGAIEVLADGVAVAIVPLDIRDAAVRVAARRPAAEPGIPASAGTGYRSVAAHVGPTPEGSSIPGPPPGFSIYPDRNDLIFEPRDELREQLTASVTLPALVPRVDVYFLVDTTSSMKTAIPKIRAVVREVVDHYRYKVPGAGDLGFGFGCYRDFPRDEFAFRHMMTPTRDVGQALSATLAWQVSGGEDGAEAQFFALDRLARGDEHWRRGGRRVVFWLGDAPGHDPIAAEYTVDGEEITEERVTDALVEADVTVFSISTPTRRQPDGLNGDPRWERSAYDVGELGTRGQATRISDATGGAHMDELDAEALIQIIDDQLNRTIDRIDRLELVATGGAARFVRKVMPAGGYGPLTRPGLQPLEFVVDFLGMVECGEDEQMFDGELQVLADGAPVAAKIVRVKVPAAPPPASASDPDDPDKTIADARRYSYSIKFVCGVQAANAKCCTPVRPGRYGTEINIHNYSPQAACVHRYVFPLVKGGKEPGRAPSQVEPTPCEELCINGNSATMIDCCALSSALDGAGELEPALAIGVLELVSDVELAITAVYTASGSGGALSVDVEQIQGRLKPSDGVSGFE